MSYNPDHFKPLVTPTADTPTVHLSCGIVPLFAFDGSALFDLARWRPITVKQYAETQFAIGNHQGCYQGVMHANEPFIPTQYSNTENSRRLLTYAVVAEAKGTAPRQPFVEPYLLALALDKAGDTLYFRRTDLDLFPTEGADWDYATDNGLFHDVAITPFNEVRGAPANPNIDFPKLDDAYYDAAGKEADAESDRASALAATATAFPAH